MILLLIMAKIIFSVGFSAFIFYDSTCRDLNGFFFGALSLALCIAGIFDIIDFKFLLITLYFSYMLFRPKEEMVYCRRCFKKKIKTKTYCPHCFDFDKKILADELRLLTVFSFDRESVEDNKKS